MCIRDSYLDDSKPIEDRIEDALSRITVEEKVALIQAQSTFSSPGVARLGIPEFWMTDGPHGIRPEVLWDEWNQAGWTNDSCVAFPALTCLAATWNPEAALLYGQSIGEEAVSYTHLHALYVTFRCCFLGQKSIRGPCVKNGSRQGSSVYRH